VFVTRKNTEILSFIFIFRKTPDMPSAYGSLVMVELLASEND
jgi:hypothetical protein